MVGSVLSHYSILFVLLVLTLFRHFSHPLTFSPEQYGVAFIRLIQYTAYDNRI